MLHLASGVSADFEGENPLEVTVRATDASGGHYDETFTINVTDVNEAPVADDSVSFTMAEDGTLLIEEAALLGSSSDPDNPEDLHVVNLELGLGASGTLTPNDAAAPEGTRTWTYVPDGDLSLIHI